MIPFATVYADSVVRIMATGGTPRAMFGPDRRPCAEVLASKIIGARPRTKRGRETHRRVAEWFCDAYYEYGDLTAAVRDGGELW